MAMPISVRGKIEAQNMKILLLPYYIWVTHHTHNGYDGTQSLGKMMQEIDCNDLFWPKTLPRPDMAMPIFD